MRAKGNRNKIIWKGSALPWGERLYRWFGNENWLGVKKPIAPIRFFVFGSDLKVSRIDRGAAFLSPYKNPYLPGDTLL
jgi:hypothetical protein